MVDSNAFIRNLKHEGKIEDFYAIDENTILGEGASSIVRKGVNLKTGDAFAIKIIDKTQLSEDEIKNLYNELTIMGMVDHPNIVRIQEYFDSPQALFIVIELMGVELFDQLVEVEHYTEQQAAEVFKQIVDAIRYCHSLGIVHRDLKPENLLYSANEENKVLKVSDFGFAKYLIPKSEDQLYTACGTPSYVAPEIISKFGYDYKVDCWSLGVILYIMLCGYPPFYAEDNNELFNLIKDCKYEFHSPYWDNISEDAKDLIRHCLVVDAKKRYDTEQMLNHPWMNKNKYSANQLSIKEDYIKFKNKSKLKSAIMASLLISAWKKYTFKKKDK